jgi:uncharacterized protein YxeA
MQDNLKNTIDTLKTYGAFESIRLFATKLKEAYDYANEVIGANLDDGSNIVKKDVDNKEINKKSIAGKSLQGNLDYSSYNKGWKYEVKYLFILEAENRFLHFREAAKILISLENLKDSEYDISYALTNAAKNIKKDGTIIKKQHDGALSSTFWGFPEWLKENGEIKAAHKYKTDILQRRKNKKHPL